jgi:transposase
MCKGIYAAFVKGKMPHGCRKDQTSAGYRAIRWGVLDRSSLDSKVICVINILTSFRVHIPELAVPAKNDPKRSKADALAAEGTLNPAPEKVRDPKFAEGEFFDPRDLLQVKYEMLRRVSVENASVTDTAEEYGVSRPTYYQARAGFEEAGIAGLVPRRPGPRGPHKLHDEILAFLQTQFIPGEPIRARALARLVQQRFDLDVHPRTIERALSGKKTPR